MYLFTNFWQFLFVVWEGYFRSRVNAKAVKCAFNLRRTPYTHDVREEFYSDVSYGVKASLWKYGWIFTHDFRKESYIATCAVVWKFLFENKGVVLPTTYEKKVTQRRTVMAKREREREGGRKKERKKSNYYRNDECRYWQRLLHSGEVSAILCCCNLIYPDVDVYS